MNTADFLAHVLPQQGILFAVLRPAGKDYWIHRPHEEYATLAYEIGVADNKKADVFFACASFDKPYIEKLKKDGTVKKKYRVQENSAFARSLWLDLDCGEEKDYATQKDAILDIKRFCNETSLPLPSVVSSGRGVHCYWSFDSDIPAAAWVKVAALWRSVVDHFNIRHDPACTTDICRILRPVGSHHRKDRDNPKEVRLIGSLRPQMPVTGFVKQLKALVAEHDVKLVRENTPPKLANNINSDLAMPAAEYPPVDAETIASNCQQVAMFKEVGGDVAEPLWYVTLGLLKFAADGEDKAHEWSSGYSGYSAEETQNKMDQWEYGPPTCAKFEQVNCEGCEGCPNRGKAKSPIQFGIYVVPSEPVVETNEETEEVEAFPELPIEMRERYAWNGKQLVAYDKDEDGVRKAYVISDFLFYPKNFHSKIVGDGETETQSSWVLRIKKGVYRNFTVTGACAGVGGRDLFSNLGRHAIFAKHGTKKYMEQYVSEWFTALRRDNDEVRAYSTFGWHGQDFLIGTDLYKPNGDVEKVRLHGDAAKYEVAFANKGELNEWVGAIDALYNRPDHEQFQWMLGVGFGAPLVRLLGPGMAGCVMSGYSSESGFGKSTAGMLALGMYGDPQKLMLTKQQTTARGVFAHCGVMNSLPILVDEITNAKAFELSEMVYTFSQGSGRVGAQSDGSLRTNVYGWATLMSSTSNKSIHGVLGSINSGSAPEIARVFEYRFRRLPNQMEIVEAGRHIPSLMANCGVAGKEYMNYIVRNQKKISEVLAATRETLTRRSALGSDARFWIAGATCVVVGLMVAKKLGLVQFDVNALSSWAIRQFKSMNNDVLSTTIDLPDQFGAMLNELSANFLVTNIYGDGRATGARAIVLHAPRGEIYGRVVNEDNMMYLSVAATRNWCNEHRVDYKQMLEMLTARGWGTALQQPVSLGRGTADFATAPSRCIEVNLASVGGELAAADAVSKLALVK